jgi:hypothetical protein
MAKTEIGKSPFFFKRRLRSKSIMPYVISAVMALSCAGLSVAETPPWERLMEPTEPDTEAIKKAAEEAAKPQPADKPEPQPVGLSKREREKREREKGETDNRERKKIEKARKEAEKKEQERLKREKKEQEKRDKEKRAQEKRAGGAPASAPAPATAVPAQMEPQPVNRSREPVPQAEPKKQPEPAKPAAPAETKKQPEPAKSEAPAKPAEPAKSAEPVKAEAQPKPAEPAKTETPAPKPVEPPKPAEPAKPAKHAAVDDEEDDDDARTPPAAPAKPEGPAKSAEAPKPAEPAKVDATPKPAEPAKADAAPKPAEPVSSQPAAAAPPAPPAIGPEAADGGAKRRGGSPSADGTVFETGKLRLGLRAAIGIGGLGGHEPAYLDIAAVVTDNPISKDDVFLGTDEDGRPIYSHVYRDRKTEFSSSVSGGVSLILLSRINSLLSISCEAQYSFYIASGSLVDDKKKGAAIWPMSEATVELHYLEIPALLRINAEEALGYPIYGEVGPQFGFNMYARRTECEDGASKIYKPNSNIFAIGPVIGAGIDLDRVNIGLRAYFGLTTYQELDGGRPWSLTVGLTSFF